MASGCLLQHPRHGWCQCLDFVHQIHKSPHCSTKFPHPIISWTSPLWRTSSQATSPTRWSSTSSTPSSRSRSSTSSSSCSSSSTSGTSHKLQSEVSLQQEQNSSSVSILWSSSMREMFGKCVRDLYASSSVTYFTFYSPELTWTWTNLTWTYLLDYYMITCFFIMIIMRKVYFYIFTCLIYLQ